MIEARMLRRLAIATTAVLLLGACGGDAASDGPRGPEASPGSGIETEATLVLIPRDGGGQVEVDVAVMDTPDERARGLMFVEELGDRQGMVFLHDEPTESGFWMKNTLIPLSLAVWDEEGTILAILDMEPCEEDPCPVYEPGAEWIGAVEVNQGFFQEHGVVVGDTARLER
jgi:uncharacterized protein